MFKKTNRSNIKSSSNDLPIELVVEILVRLPAKALTRFRNVSRTWRNIIDERNFMFKQLQLTKTRNEQRYILSLEDFKFDTVFTSRSGIEYAHKMELIQIPLEHDTEVLGCVNGVVLMKINGTYILLNPSIKKMVRLSPSPCACNHSRIVQIIEYALGFDSLTNDFKVVAIQKYDMVTISSIEVYTLSTSSWRTVTIDNIHEVQKFRLASEQVIFAQGSVYWKGVVWENNLFINHVMSFDFEREVFKLMPLPLFSSTSFHFLYGDSLAIFDITLEVTIRIWVMEKDASSGVEFWKKSYSCLFKGNLWELYPILYTSLLTLRVLYLEDCHRVLFVSYWGQSIYDIESGEINCTLMFDENQEKEIYFVDHCVESLFLCNTKDDPWLKPRPNANEIHWDPSWPTSCVDGLA